MTFTKSLALQLARRDPVFAKALAEKNDNRHITIDISQQAQEVSGQQIGLVINKLELGSVSAEDAFSRVVREPLEILSREAPHEQVLILFDALDEALAYGGNVGIVSLIADHIIEICNHWQWL